MRESWQTAQKGSVDFPNRDTATTPTTSIHPMGSTCNHLPPSPLQNSKDFEKTPKSSPRHKTAIPHPPIVAFRYPHNLRDLLVRAKLKKMKTPTQTGNSHHNSTHCKTCQMTMRVESFMIHSTGTKQKTRFLFTCKTRNLVYLIQCRKCCLARQQIFSTSEWTVTDLTSTPERLTNL